MKKITRLMKELELPNTGVKNVYLDWYLITLYCPVSFKKPRILDQTCSPQLEVCFNICDLLFIFCCFCFLFFHLLVDTGHERVKILVKIENPLDIEYFWSNPYKIEVMITFFIEMLQLPNFGHMTTSII